MSCGYGSNSLQTAVSEALLFKMALSAVHILRGVIQLSSLRINSFVSNSYVYIMICH